MPIANRARYSPAKLVLTPVEEHGGYLVKRDDLANERGTRGGKARTLGVICRHVITTGRRGLTAYMARMSVAPGVIGGVCSAYGVPACLHTAAARGRLAEPFQEALRCGARVVEHRPGYLSVLAARARAQAAADDYMLVGLGFDFPPAILETAKQCQNIPRTIRRLVTSVGSGHMLEGIVRGLEDMGLSVPVLGVCVGKRPAITFPPWVTLVTTGTPYATPASESLLGKLRLNPYYEAKALPYLRPGDLLWLVATPDASKQEAPLLL